MHPQGSQKIKQKPRIYLDLDNTLLHAIPTRLFHKKYKDKLLHKKFPIYWGNQTPYPARAYYISDELGLEEKFTQELFDTNFKLNINIFRPRVINLLAEDYGIQEEMETGMQSKSTNC